MKKIHKKHITGTIVFIESSKVKENIISLIQSKENNKWYRPVVVCDDEIKVGDLVLTDDRFSRSEDPIYNICKVTKIINEWIYTDSETDIGYNPDWTKKIIATPNNFTKEHMEMFRTGKLKDGDIIENITLKI